MDKIYKENYELPGRKVTIVDGEVINRETMVAKNLIKLLDLEQFGRFLDVGAGAGYLLTAFASELPEWEIAGYDVSDNQKGIICKSGSAQFYSGVLSDVPGYFDLITFNHVVEHLTEPVTTIRIAAGLLKPGGSIVVIVPNFQTVYSDFFFLEHCSHFTARTLNIVASLAGLSIINTLEGLISPTEIGFVGRQAEQKPSQSAALEAIRWAQALPNFIRAFAKDKAFGVFGVNGAGMWLGAALKGKLSFFVDDDPSKQGSRFAGCPILSVDEIADGALVFVPYNNPEASLEMCTKLKKRRPEVAFVAPPWESGC
ncbi:hypothetical protein B1812_21485 [Methylocystis bryophila]|uniref:Uncharacterized protein n=2 Tax=Methylocystis bryophila TaxID=655015 RepID=A0A1W6N060_9HYPH|nr:hypothetical protein B1812_21485 [Methylocystis bryophila]